MQVRLCGSLPAAFGALEVFFILFLSPCERVQVAFIPRLYDFEAIKVIYRLYLQSPVTKNMTPRWARSFTPLIPAQCYYPCVISRHYLVRVFFHPSSFKWEVNNEHYTQEKQKERKTHGNGSGGDPLILLALLAFKKTCTHAHFGVKMAKELPLIIIHTTIMLKLQSNHKQK